MSAMTVFSVERFQYLPARLMAPSLAHSASTWSMHSTNISVRAAPRLPKISQSDGSPPGLMPKMNRPSSRLSSIATLDAIAAGWPFGRLTVPVQSLMFFVAGARLARNTEQSVMVSAVSVTCSPT